MRAEQGSSESLARSAGPLGLREHRPSADAADDRTREILEYRSTRLPTRRRGWLVRRVLLLADVLRLVAAFATVELTLGLGRPLKGGAGVEVRSRSFWPRFRSG